MHNFKVDQFNKVKPFKMMSEKKGVDERATVEKTFPGKIMTYLRSCGIVALKIDFQ